MKKIGVFGLWHLGCVISATWSKSSDVIGYDYDYENVEKLKNGTPPIYEPFLEEAIKENLNKTLKFTNDQSNLNDCDFIFLAYDTPVNDDDSSNITILTKSIEDLSKVLKDNTIVIISSQSPIGFCSELRTKLKKHNSTLELAYSPENLRLGEALKCYSEPDRIILGTNNKETEEKCVELFNQILIQDSILTMSLESAEMVKHGINSFLAMSIVFTNHLADICSEKGANIKDVVRGLKSDSRIGQKAYLSPGIGFSGGTLGRDLKVLKQANNKGYAKLFGSIHKFNDDRKKSIISKIKNNFGKIKNKKIGVLGLTYKPGTSTLRRSLPVEITNLIIKKGAKVKVFDPKADYNELTKKTKFKIEKSIIKIIEKVDYIVLMTEWSEFRDFDWSSITKEISILDTKNFLNSDNLPKNIKYYSV